MTKILIWVWGVVITLIVIGVAVGSFKANTFGDGIVSNISTWFTSGIKIGQAYDTSATGKPNKLRAIISSSSAQNAFTLGTVGSATSTFFTTTTLAYDGYDTDGPIAVGAACVAGITTAPTTTAFEVNAQVLAVSTTAQTITVGNTYANDNSSTVTIATGTVTDTCFNTPY